MILARRLLFLFPLMLVLTLGCKPKNPNAPARVSGMITYKGKPLPGGTITFYTDGAGIYPLPIDPDGTYEGTGLPVGDLAVTIDTESAKAYGSAAAYGDGRGHQMQFSPAPGGHEQTPRPQYVPIPKKYANLKTSGLSMTLQPGRNTKNFDLGD